MKALTVRDPWAWLIIHGGKNVENRTRRTNFRGRVAIHAGLQQDKEAMRALPRVDPSGKPRAFMPGHVIGTVEIVGCHHADECAEDNWHPLCSEWAQPGAWHWELANPEPVDPFKAKGMLGFWTVEM